LWLRSGRACECRDRARAHATPTANRCQAHSHTLTLSHAHATHRHHSSLHPELTKPAVPGACGLQVCVPFVADQNKLLGVHTASLSLCVSGPCTGVRRGALRSLAHAHAHAHARDLLLLARPAHPARWRVGSSGRRHVCCAAGWLAGGGGRGGGRCLLGTSLPGVCWRWLRPAPANTACSVCVCVLDAGTHMAAQSQG
jgi:hypothetical protein